MLPLNFLLNSKTKLNLSLFKLCFDFNEFRNFQSPSYLCFYVKWHCILYSPLPLLIWQQFCSSSPFQSDGSCLYMKDAYSQWIHHLARTVPVLDIFPWRREWREIDPGTPKPSTCSKSKSIWLILHVNYSCGRKSIS